MRAYYETRIERALFGPSPLMILALVLTACGQDSQSGEAENEFANIIEPPPGFEERMAKKRNQPTGKQELQMLYDELQGFKSDPKFHQVVFGVCCEYRLWRQRVHDLSNRSGTALLKEVGFLPGELINLASAYAESRGRKTHRTRYLEQLIHNGLTPPLHEKGGGILTTNGKWCTDITPVLDMIRGIETNEMSLQLRPETDPSCRDYPRGSTVGPILATRPVNFSDGTPLFEFVQVVGPDKRKIWVSKKETSFP